MRPPRTALAILGHPAVATPLLLGGGYFLFLCWQVGTDGFLPALLTLFMMSRIVRASDTVSAYRSWKRAWNGMAEPPSQDGRARP